MSKKNPRRVEGGAPDDIDITNPDNDDTTPAREAVEWPEVGYQTGIAGVSDEVLADAQARTSASLNPEFYALPGCGACGGIEVHQRTCAAYDEANIITAPGGWCAPVDRLDLETVLTAPPPHYSRFLQPVPTNEDPLDVDQLGRVEALKAARSVLQTSAGLFGGTSTGNHSVDDLIRIARFITTGQDPQ